MVVRRSVGHWDYFASLGVRRAAVASGQRREGQEITRRCISDFLPKDDLKGDWVGLWEQNWICLCNKIEEPTRTLLRPISEITNQGWKSDNN